MYDADGNGWIDLMEMTRIVKSIYSMMGPKQVYRLKYLFPTFSAKHVWTMRFSYNVENCVSGFIVQKSFRSFCPGL